jgi:hypothetical protein
MVVFYDFLIYRLNPVNQTDAFLFWLVAHICLSSTLYLYLGHMTTYTYTYTIPLSAYTHTTGTDNDSDHWSDIITTPTSSSASTSILFKSSSWHPHPHEHDHTPEYNNSPKKRYDTMEESWRDYPLPASPLTDLSSGIAPHGIGGHRRGPSELESTILWDTSQTNGELGLDPNTQMGGDMKAGFPSLPVTMSSRKHSQAISTSALPTSNGQLPLPLPIAVWATIMDSSKGRDKVLVCPSHL